MAYALVLRPLAWGLAEDPFVALLREAGVDAVACPLTRIVPDLSPERTAQIHDFLENCRGCDMLAFTSATGVRSFRHFFGAQFLALPAKPAVAVVGSATLSAARELGFEASIVPRAFHARALAEELALRLPRGGRVLHARAAEAEPLEGALGVPLYRASAIHENEEKLKDLLRENPPDWIPFTSPAQVRTFAKICGEEGCPAHSRLFSIGPSTSRALEGLGLRCDGEAREASLGALAELIKK
jgi:uroporphyrinogen-III synthase